VEYRFRGGVLRVRTGCRRAPEAGSTKRLHFGSINRLHFAGNGARRAAVVAVTNGRLDGFALLTRTFGTWERIFYGEFGGQRRSRPDTFTAW
jgi:hypothetical protein